MTVYNSPAFAPLREHIPSNVTQATLEQLSDNSLATDGEIKIILAVHPQLQTCKKQALDRISQSTPPLVPSMLTVITKGEDSLIDLIQKKQTWGAHIRRVRDAAIAGTAEWQAESQRIEAGLQQSHEAELAHRQAAGRAEAAALAQYTQTQQLINSMNRPDSLGSYNQPFPAYGGPGGYLTMPLAPDISVTMFPNGGTAETFDRGGGWSITNIDP